MSVVMFSGRTPRPGLFIAALTWVLCFVAATTARAASIVEFAGGGSSSLAGLGAFTGSISYATNSAFSTTGTLTVALTNTSDSGNGGFITGLLFNIGGNDTSATATLESATHSFSSCEGTGLNGAPFGTFDAGAAIGGSFLGGGNPNPGIAVGETGIFTFMVSAFDAGTLTAMDFLSGGPFGFNFLVRFRGFDDDGSDKVGAMLIPVPPAFPMAMTGLVALITGLLIRRGRANVRSAKWRFRLERGE